MRRLHDGAAERACPVDGSVTRLEPAAEAAVAEEVSARYQHRLAHRLLADGALCLALPRLRQQGAVRELAEEARAECRRDHLPAALGAVNQCGGRQPSAAAQGRGLCRQARGIQATPSAAQLSQEPLRWCSGEATLARWKRAFNCCVCAREGQERVRGSIGGQAGIRAGEDLDENVREYDEGEELRVTGPGGQDLDPGAYGEDLAVERCCRLLPALVRPRIRSMATIRNRGAFGAPSMAALPAQGVGHAGGRARRGDGPRARGSTPGSAGGRKGA
jgi:hypothetical protein